MTHHLLRDLFRPIGEIDQIKLCRNKETHLPLGYGFVKYKNPSDAAKAVRMLNGRTIQEKQIKVSFARPSSELIKNTNLYVSGIPKHWTNDEISSFFGRAGKIISVRILTCRTTGQSRGVCFVRFDTKPEALLAVNMFHGKPAMESSSANLTVKVSSNSYRNRLNLRKMYLKFTTPLDENSNTDRRIASSATSANAITKFGLRQPQRAGPMQNLKNIRSGPVQISGTLVFCAGL